MCCCAGETLLVTSLQQLCRWRESRASGGNPEEDRLRSARRRGASAAGSDRSPHSTEEALLEQRASEKSRMDTRD